MAWTETSTPNGGNALHGVFQFADFAEAFASIDKNDDGVLCAKLTPGLFNTVDNTSNA